MQSKRYKLMLKVEKKNKSFLKCEYCGEVLDKFNLYHKTYRTCNSECHMYMVGMSWSDFY